MDAQMQHLRDQVMQSVALKMEWFHLEASASIMTMAVDEVAQAILNYCNICTIPDMLCSVWANMVLDYLRWGAAATEDSSSGGFEISAGKSPTPTYLSSLSEGNASLGFSTDSNSQWSLSAKAHDPSSALDQIVLNYADQLNRYRKVVW